LTISRSEIENQGFSSVADILQNISAAGSPSFSRASPLTSNQEAGGQYIDLRNLGPQRTLVLVNGKRLGISPAGFQDISSAPSVSPASPRTCAQEAGGQYIDLRNRGPPRTLVLVSGKRLGISPAGFQDSSSVPSVIVERIEVLKDGASAIYFSDAMAGVINI